MLTQEQIKKIDLESMHSVYDKWPKNAEISWNKEITKLDIRDVNHVVFAGMGGSGTIGDIFSSILSKNQIHVSVVKGYHLPKTVDERTLVVCTSISGNTTETLSILEKCRNSAGKFIAFSSSLEANNSESITLNLSDRIFILNFSILSFIISLSSREYFVQLTIS